MSATSPVSARLDQPLTTATALKTLVLYAVTQLDKKILPTRECASSSDFYATIACKVGIIDSPKIAEPRHAITRWELANMLSTLLRPGKYTDTKEQLTALQKAGIISSTDPKTPEVGAYLMLMLERIHKLYK